MANALIASRILRFIGAHLDDSKKELEISAA